MGLFKLITILIYYGVPLLLHTFCRCHIRRGWNECPPQADAKRLLLKLSFDECIKQCLVRRDCQAVCYWKFIKLCEIHDTIEENVPCKDCLSVYRKDITTEKYNIPSGTCQDDGQFCNIKTRKCEYECGKISYPYTKIKGNLANVGAKIIVGCINDINNQQTIVECNDVGIWTTLPSCDEFQCPMNETPYFLSRDLQIIISKQPKTQQEAKLTCDIKGGNLVRFDEVNKARQIRNILQNCTDFQSSDYWVDGKRIDDGHDFYFSNGKTMLMDVGIYWAENTPNGGGEQCTRMDDRFDFLLNDKECNDRMGFVCEIPKIHERNGATQHGLL